MHSWQRSHYPALAETSLADRHASAPGTAAPVLSEHPPVQPEGVPAPSRPGTNNAFLYCLIDAALRCEVDVLLPCVMSNHYHAVIYDRAGRNPEFIEHLQKLVARSQNALRGGGRTCGRASRSAL
jgi:hypothetical protein